MMQQLKQISVRPVVGPQAEPSPGEGARDDSVAAWGLAGNASDKIVEQAAAPSPSAFDTFAAFLGLIAIDLIVKFKGFPYLYRVVKGWPVSRKRAANKDAISRICAAVDNACTYYLKQALCLQRSALATCLLRRQGVEAQMVIGCRKIPFGGHAWVEVNGEVVNDKKEVVEIYGVLDRC